jgi:predicted RNA-binding Zn-ribbon protein involved in translation (DUF1610 family)
VKTVKPRRIKQVHSFRVDVAKTDKKGAFSCPSCGIIISPSNHSEKTYSILEAKMNSGELEEIIICCKRCGSQIYLTGFSIDPELHTINDDITHIPHV